MSGLLENKTALIFGVANERSIAWGIAKAFHAQGATVGISYVGESLAKRAIPLGESIGATFIESCDVSSDDEIAAVFEKAKTHFGEIDILVHAIAFAKREELSGAYFSTSRDGFQMAMDISVYSLTALVQAFHPMIREGGSIMTMTYYGAEKVVPSYNVMGIAKAALEASVRYLARDMGQQKVRVNAISAGPIRTLAASGVSGFRDNYKRFVEVAPIGENITTEDVGGAAVFLASEMSSRITGEILYVDGGFNIIGIAEEKEVE